MMQNFKASSIEDVNNGNTRPNSPCDHYSINTSDITFERNMERQIVGNYEYIVTDISCPNVQSTAANLQSNIGSIAPGQVNTDELIQSVFDDLSGGMDFGLLSLATIAEVGSLKKLSKNFSEIVRNIKSTFSHRTTLGKLKSASKADLGIEYGGLTLYRDIFAAINVAAAVEKHMLKLARRNAMSKFVIRKMAAPVPCGGGYPGTTRGIVTAVCSGSYALNEADVTYQILRYFGFTNIASTAWELVPFSFIVDWFVDIGSAIKRLENDVVNGLFNRSHTTIHEMYYTTITEGRRKLPVFFGPSVFSYPSHPLGWHHIPVKRYIRAPIDWTSSSILDSLELSGLSATQMVKGGQVFLNRRR
jgi:hypothetical protein